MVRVDQWIHSGKISLSAASIFDHHLTADFAFEAGKHTKHAAVDQPPLSMIVSMSIMPSSYLGAMRT